VWGVNGWQVVPEAVRPPGTVVKDNKLMHSRMVRKGNTFATTVRVPSGTRLDYGFLITKTEGGTTVDIWQGEDEDRRPFAMDVRSDGWIEVKSTAWLSGQAADLPLVTQEIRYPVARAGKVWLVWGINGRQVVPEAVRPPGTVVKDGVMHTPMAFEGYAFVAKVQVPSGTRINYRFLITTYSGAEVTIWQDNTGREYLTVVRGNGSLEVKSTVRSPTTKEVQEGVDLWMYILLGTCIVLVGCLVFKFISQRQKRGASRYHSRI